MEEEGTVILTISHLIQRACPITAASYSVPRSPISTSKPHKNPGGNYRHEESFRTCENPTLQTLKPLNYPTFLVGTLALPSFANCNSPIKCSCFQFSDDSATICCDILDFDPKMIGQKIRILTWNFIPLTCGNGGEKDGFLEIISWEVFQACSGDVCSFSDSSSFCLSLGVCDVKNKSKTSSLIFGIVESISPVFVVPCVSGESGSRNISGFLVDVLVCQCKFCVSKFLASELRDLTEEKVKDHSFEKRAIVYFSGLTSSWHPVVSRFISNVIWLTGLKQKLVFITNEESKLMYVTTDEASLHVTKFFKEQGLSRNTNIKGRGEIGSYTGVITAIYMQGMVVELDQDVILLLTDQHLIVPHCVRVGAIVTLENVHFVDPKFPWAEMLILGACCRTSMYVESFSPLETRGHLKSHSQTLLQKFINSLPFAARLWALLVVSCFRKKFAGILPEKVILGSKHKEGLAQEYASSHLPPSAFQFRHGVLVEFCRHDSCSVGKEEHYFHLRLVLPIANLISYCEISWKKILVNRENFSDFVGDINQKKPLSCGGRSYVQSIRRVLRTEEIGILVLGTLKTSIYSGRLQLVDATGGVDIMLDLPATWNFDKIFEAKDFTLIMEGVPPDLVDSDSTICQPLSCQSIFSTAQPLRTMKISIYLYHCSTDDSRSHSLFFDGKGDLLELDRGKFHLLMLTHKYPIQQRFQGDRAKRSNMFAQAIVLHWDLLVAGKDKDAVRNMVSAGHWKDLLENFTRQENHLTHKRCKTEQALVEVSNCGLNDSGDVLNCQFSGSCCADRNLYTGQTCISNQLLELPCLVASKGVNSHCLATLCCTIEQAKIVSGCVLPRRKVLLEFSPDSFCMYEVLRIGRCYLVQHKEEDILCYPVGRLKVFITSSTKLWCLTFSSMESLQGSDVSDGLQYCNIPTNSDGKISKGYRQLEIPCLTGNAIDNEIYTDVSVFVPSSALNLLETVIGKLDGGSLESKDSFEEESDIHDLGGSMVNASTQSSGNPWADYTLPEGNLITLRGLVVALHDCSCEAFPAQPMPIPGESYLPFLRGTGGVCVHVLVDNKIVRVFCDLNKQTYPVGLVGDVCATFHRVLVLTQQKKYMMTPVSFITIDDTSLINGHTDEFNYAHETVVKLSNTSQSTVPPVLISDALQLSDLKPMQFRCRVVALYILVVQKAKATAVSRSCGCSILSGVEIPLAGFIMDDGSSSCCCWADSERAAALLGLESEEILLEESAETSGRSKAGKGQQYNSTVSHLDKILEQHGRVVAKNYGSMFDSSFQDLALSVGSGRSISSSEQDLLRSLTTKAFLSASWTIVGSLMHPEASRWLEQQLTELDMAVPSLPNVWAASVNRTDVLAEARNTIQWLM
ncbi:CST complex subunit CTC1 [Sesamum indicum]|uniref:CST complex subunit CTC1 n=1 Tax=Sesamum indicum TaxID=4182 RepID=A0A6I9TFY1_SESIN|nr:CST complex subunit CTC1 [Sesamum indicum]